MYPLSFKQKIGFGFGFIIVLILTSGLSALWNLNDINVSTTRLNQTAVPVVKESNKAQIQLLKLAKLSNLAFNTDNADHIRVLKRRFDQGVQAFDTLYSSLETLSADDADMKALVIGIKSNYDFYRFAVAEMFEARAAEPETDLAKLKLNEANASVSQSIKGLEELLDLANEQFSFMQGKVLSSLDFGFRFSIVMLAALVLLAARNFNSMRSAIHQKMTDLTELNQVAGSLATAHNQNAALEEVLRSMHNKMGVCSGSIYLNNEKQELVVTAHFPPKAISSNFAATKFKLDEGVIGKAAKSRKISFVPNTAREKSYVQGEHEGAPKALLCVPLVDKGMLVGVINLSGDVKKVSFTSSDCEYVSSIAPALVTAIKNIRLREVIEENARTLEAKVEKRTEALHQKSQDIAYMMANMHQGLFTVTAGGLVHKEYSAYLEQLFETDRISGRNVNDLLFANSALGARARDKNIAAVDTIVGNDVMIFDINSNSLVNEMTLKFEGGREKILKLDWDPIVNDDDVIERLMITVRDVTELRALELAAQGQKHALALIG